MRSWGGRRGLVILTLTAAVGGVVAIVWGVAAQQSAPQPPASAAGTVSSRAFGSTHHASTRSSTHSSASHGPARHRAPRVTSGPPPRPASEPVSIDIPAIRVQSAVIPIGKAADGTLAVPQPGPNLNKAAWYKDSVTPGEDGPSVIEGHIDSIHGPSVFYELGAIRPGDKIRVTRADHSMATFTVNGVRAYASHDDFPTAAVYGSDLDRPTLRLITCSNFDHSIGHYLGNTVVFAHLTAFHKGR